LVELIRVDAGSVAVVPEAVKPVTAATGSETALQLKVVPETLPVRVTAVELVLLHIVCSRDVLVKLGAGLTVTT
jgi:hypothetical protein